MWTDLVALLGSRPAFVAVVSWLGLALQLGVLFALVSIVILRVRLWYAESQARRVREEWLPVLRSLREGHSVEVPAVGRARLRYLLELWAEERELADEDYGRSLDSLAFQVGLDDEIFRILQLHPMVLVRRKIWLQSIAITAAEWIDTDRTREALATMTDSEDYFLAGKACACLVKLDAEAAEQQIIGTLFRFPKHAPYISVQLSQAGASSVLHVLEPFFDMLPAYAEMNFVSLLERTDDKSLLPMLVKRLDTTEQDEEKAAILRALGRIGSPHERGIVIRYLTHEIDFIRIQAIKTLGRIGQPADRELLVPHLSDRNWWIRYRTARSYIRLTTDDRDEIEPFISSLSDPYARDIMHHALAELEWWRT